MLFRTIIIKLLTHKFKFNKDHLLKSYLTLTTLIYLLSTLLLKLNFLFLITCNYCSPNSNIIIIGLLFIYIKQFTPFLIYTVSIYMVIFYIFLNYIYFPIMVNVAYWPLFDLILSFNLFLFFTPFWYNFFIYNLLITVMRFYSIKFFNKYTQKIIILFIYTL